MVKRKAWQVRLERCQTGGDGQTGGFGIISNPSDGWANAVVANALHAYIYIFFGFRGLLYIYVIELTLAKVL